MKLKNAFDQNMLQTQCKAKGLNLESLTEAQVCEYLPYLREQPKAKVQKISKATQLNHEDMIRVLNDFCHFKSETIKQELADLGTDLS